MKQLKFGQDSLTHLQAAHMMTTNDRAKQLLARIIFWVPKASIVKKDKLWIAKSREDWAAETKDPLSICLLELEDTNVCRRCLFRNCPK